MNYTTILTKTKTHNLSYLYYYIYIIIIFIDEEHAMPCDPQKYIYKDTRTAPCPLFLTAHGRLVEGHQDASSLV